MSIYIEKEFVGRIRNKLPGVTQKSEFLWNFRCPVCGDSKKNKSKMRGYIYRRKNDLLFTCHNCNLTWPFAKFLDYVDHAVYMEYKLALFRKDHVEELEVDAKSNPQEKFKVAIGLPTIDSLPAEHFARQFIQNRKIPKERWSSLYYSDDFAKDIFSFVPDREKFSFELAPNEKRIVIPFYDENKNLLGVQGRALGNSKSKYISVKLNPDNPKIFGLDTLDVNKPIIVVEGPFDSMFLDNAVAVMDSHLEHIFKYLGHDKEFVFVYDNEPRNSNIVKTMNRTIANGHQIVIWPKEISEKDINDMILSGKTSSEIMWTINRNTFDGPRALLEFGKWRKC